jgi:hypothetical protein
LIFGCISSDTHENRGFFAFCPVGPFRPVCTAEPKVAKRFFQEVLKQAQERNQLSDEHFTADGTLIEAWASLKELSTEGTGEAGEWG